MGISRTRNYTTVVYPESFNFDFLDDLHVDFVMSPYHEFDSNPDGSLKKGHYHIMLMYDSVKTLQQAKSDVALFGGVGCEPVKSTRGMLRYFCHLDNPEKHQYPTSEVFVRGDLNYNDLIKSYSDNLNAVKDMLHFINDNHITSYFDFLFWCSDNNEYWFNLLVERYSYVIDKAIKSATYCSRKEKEENEK